MPRSTPLPLTGRGILITRPAAQSQALAASVVEHGGRPVVFPVVEIAEIDDSGTLAQTIDALHTYDLAIFVSPTAVAKGWDAIHARRSFPADLRVAAVGQGSARALRRLGVGAVMAPSAGADSESLLALPELQDVSGRRIVVFRGQGGRELMRDSLVSRGATVDYAECYRRVCPHVDAGPLVRALSEGEIHAIVITSAEALRNLWNMLEAAGRVFLATTPIFVPHPRIAAAARELELPRVTVTGPGDEATVRSLCEYFAPGRRAGAVLPRDSE
jgi:uroporphyrinogen-III synthase